MFVLSVRLGFVWVMSLVLLSDCDKHCFPCNARVYLCNVGCKVVSFSDFMFVLGIFVGLFAVFKNESECFMCVLSLLTQD